VVLWFMNALLLPKYGVDGGKFSSKHVPQPAGATRPDIENKSTIYLPVMRGPVRSWDGLVRPRAAGFTDVVSGFSRTSRTS